MEELSVLKNWSNHFAFVFLFISLFGWQRCQVLYQLFLFFYLLSFPRKLDSSKIKIQWKINTYKHTYRVNIMYQNVLKNSTGK